MSNFSQEIHMQSQDYTLTLDYVSNKVNGWRRNKKHRSELMPEELKILIVRLTKLYSAHKISASLKISLSTLYQFKRIYSDNFTEEEARLERLNKSSIPETEEQKINFIPVKLSSLAISEEPKDDNSMKNPINTSISSNAATTCQIIRPDGAKLVLNTSNPTVIIQAFLCSN